MSLHSMDSYMNFRMSSSDKMTIEKAALLKGLKPNTYARQKLLEIAEHDINELSQLNRLILNDKQWDQFMAVMEAPPQKINKNLKKAIQSYKKMRKQ